jgi:hypothetical protein
VPRLVHAEWTKARTVRSLPAVLLLTAAVVVLPGLAVAAATVVQLGTLSPQARASFDPSAAALSGVSLATLAAAVLGALMIGGEYATGAVRTLLVTAPRRWDVLLAKAVVLVLSVAPVAAAATAVTFVGAQRVLGTRDLDTPVTAGLATTAAGAALALTSAALLGLAVATVVRSTTTATVVLVAVLLVLPTLAGLVPGSTGRQVQRVLPSTALDGCPRSRRPAPRCRPRSRRPRSTGRRSRRRSGAGPSCTPPRPRPAASPWPSSGRTAAPPSPPPAPTRRACRCSRTRCCAWAASPRPTWPSRCCGRRHGAWSTSTDR